MKLIQSTIFTECFNVCHVLFLSTSFKITEDKFECFLLDWESEVTGESTGKPGAIGAIRRCCPCVDKWSSTETGRATWRGAVKGLKFEGSFLLVLFLLGDSWSTSSVFIFKAGKGGDDSRSRNFTNSSEKLWRRKIKIKNTKENVFRRLKQNSYTSILLSKTLC